MNNILNYFLNKQWIFNIVIKFFSEERQEYIHKQKTRLTLNSWGIDTSDMSDQDIEDSFIEMRGAILFCGVSVDELKKVMTELGDWVRGSSLDVTQHKENIK